MFRKMMLAGLMTATVFGGIAPAYAQSDPGQRGERGNGGERAQRQDGGGERMRGDRGPQQQRGNPQVQPRGDQQAPSRGDAGGQRWQQRAGAGGQMNGGQMNGGQMAPPRPDARWRGEPNLPANRAVENDVRMRREQQQQQQQQNWRNAQRDDRRDIRQDWRNGRDDRRGDGRPGWNNDRGNDRSDWRNAGRNDDRRWSDNRGGNWNNGSWNNGRRFDDRTRWSNQQRWNNGWRQDRRYDWQGYRNRYGDRFRMGNYYAPRGWDYGYRRFSVGIMLNSLLYSNSYWLDDPYAYRLPPAYGSLRWVRYYDDAMLVDIRDGYVVDVIHDFFW
ncbi:RcnB family protein [Sphingobium sp. YR768]|uniref:RcnB family protein n=1 Tax=Sphingobium sp. YR768 TaxID=1884365 RepID=UPI00210CA751|nr:RcnB family protein [Sphingobium sp. YR768]